MASSASARVAASFISSIGRSAIESTMARLTQPAEESPTKTSAPSIASARVRAGVSEASSSLYGFIPSSRPVWITPFESHSTRFSGATPRDR